MEQELLQTLPKSGTIVNGKLSEQTKWELGTEERESGLWLTPSTVQIEPTKERREKRIKFRKSIGRKDLPGSLAEQVATKKFIPIMWRTPDANMERGKRSYENMKSKIDREMPLNLNDQLNAIEKGLLKEPKMFPTPTTMEIEHKNIELTKEGRRKHKDPNSKYKDHSLNLADTVRMFPTPTTADTWTDKLKSSQQKEGSMHSVNLSQAVHMKEIFPTPTANEDAAGTPNGKMQKMLGNCEEVRSQGTGTLNPMWVEWLMGFPIGWTDLED